MTLNNTIVIKIAFRNKEEKEVFDTEIKKIFNTQFKESDTTPGAYIYALDPLNISVHKAPGRKAILDQSEISQLYVQHYEHKKSLKELSEQYNCSKSTIKKYLRDYKNSSQS